MIIIFIDQYNGLVKCCIRQRRLHKQDARLRKYEEDVKEAEEAQQKQIKKMMHLQLDSLMDFGGCWESKRRQVGNKINEKSI